jgi:multidrug efflux pump
MAIVMADPAVANVSGSTGGSGGPGGGGGRNNANFYITLKPLAERGLSADAVVARLRGKLAHERRAPPRRLAVHLGEGVA